MRRRNMLAFLGAGPLTMAAAAGEAWQEDEKPRAAMGVVNDPRSDCHQSCERVAKSCRFVGDLPVMNELKERRGDAGPLVKLHQAMADVREVCELVSWIAVRDSPFRASLCRSCAEVCDQCAEIVGATDYEQKDAYRKDDLADQLRECAGYCRTVARLR